MYRLAACTIILLALLRVFRRLRDGSISPVRFVALLAGWLAILVVSLVPELSSSWARSLGIGRGADLLFSFSILLLLYFCFCLYVRSERTRQELTRIVRELALRDFERAGESAQARGASDTPRVETGKQSAASDEETA